MDHAAPYLTRMSPALRRALLVWSSWRHDVSHPPRFDEMQIVDIATPELAASVGEVIREGDDPAPADFRLIYVCPNLRHLALDKEEGALFSERRHSRPGSPTFTAAHDAATLGKAQFFDASGSKGVLGFRKLEGLSLPLWGDTDHVDYVMTVVCFER